MLQSEEKRKAYRVPYGMFYVLLAVAYLIHAHLRTKTFLKPLKTPKT